MNFDSSFLFKGKDADSMAELIIDKYLLIKQYPHKWQEISYRCRKFVEDNYSLEKNLEVFEKTIARHC